MSKISINTENLVSCVSPLYKKYPGHSAPQGAYIQIDEKGVVSAGYYDQEQDGEPPEEECRYQVIRLIVFPYITGDDLVKFLTREDIVALLERIHAGHAVDEEYDDLWDLSGDAYMTLIKLSNVISAEINYPLMHRMVCG
ncbi:hypothetical protein A6M27_02840 [Acidithiobacillus thiooxidans]|uniref:Uncharacterized protein n=1 Tax=Acidithiobacillus thiooxidans TaxID=930 RepID=A0A1C2IPM8_ACITH|nr:hypothetical protein [Acidithiobacillus thiooxidans]OCX76243.1 hypothetical protein A6P07_02810 [Acidithiobacillus thiooxidans]OCX77952.1 hypothetical protein A6O24_05675 [Acidithiobacillus thiooxidans]OCX84907.1 hypothetical protein A6O26_02880 [Acidithiobacillus thiooxidans]OCX89286.1 hypothetical protein A6M27_02840 [Acidithiobacillus thiooxidans]OFC49104.1 hypothetical protein BAE47_05995 [Acidithiobacillus thiooxidans]